MTSESVKQKNAAQIQIQKNAFENRQMTQIIEELEEKLAKCTNITQVTQHTIDPVTIEIVSERSVLVQEETPPVEESKEVVTVP